PLPPQARQPDPSLAAFCCQAAPLTGRGMACRRAPRWRSHQRTIETASHAATATARTAPAVSAAMRITSRAIRTIWATMGPILATTNAAPTMIATAAMPAPWPPGLSQHDGLHMTGRRGVGSVDHATHLFLSMDVRDGFSCGWPGWRVGALQARHLL